jgi:predicted TPR repeat methyltransferase
MPQPTAFDRALALHRQGRLADAEPLYRRVLRTAPTHFDTLHLLGALCGQTDRFDEALQLLQRALAQKPDSAPALVNLGNTLGNLGRHLEAVQAFERALAVRPDDAKALRNRGTSLRALERPEEALASFDAALALQPDYPEALIGRAEALLTLHRRAQAIEAFQKALPLGKDVDQIRYALASLGVGEAPSSAPPAYVEALFDMYAHNFDAHLVQRLAYRTPELLVAELRSAQPPTPADVIDLGCGTGLCGPLLRPLAQAREGGAYDELVQGDVAAALAARPAAFDIAAAADVFVYIGDLAEVFRTAAAALRAGGLFAFSVEACADAEGDFRLGATRRYAHSLAYLQRLAAAHGFAVERAQHSVIRKESDQGVDGLLVVLRRAEA